MPNDDDDGLSSGNKGKKNKNTEETMKALRMMSALLEPVPHHEP